MVRPIKVGGKLYGDAGACHVSDVFPGVPEIPIKFNDTLLYQLIPNTKKVTILGRLLLALESASFTLENAARAQLLSSMEQDLNQAQSRKRLYVSPDRSKSVPDAYAS